MRRRGNHPLSGKAYRKMLAGISATEDAMNPQPVSLADELRGLADDLNCQMTSGAGYTAHIETKCPRCRLLALLRQHAVAEPQRILTDAHVRGAMAYADSLDTFPDNWAQIVADRLNAALVAAAHAAEQPKLTEEVREFATEFLVFAKFAFGDSRNAWPMSVYHLSEMADALLTSPVAPPPPIGLAGIIEGLREAEHIDPDGAPKVANWLDEVRRIAERMRKFALSGDTVSSNRVDSWASQLLAEPPAALPPRKKGIVEHFLSQEEYDASVEKMERENCCNPNCAKHHPPPVAPGEQPPRKWICACAEGKDGRPIMDKDCMVHAPDPAGAYAAPPAQERASDEPTTFEKWWNENFGSPHLSANQLFGLGPMRSATEDAFLLGLKEGEADAATAAKLAREEATLAEHKSHIEFENELYATLVDPVAEGNIKEAEMRKQLLESARWYRQHVHDLEAQLNAIHASGKDHAG